MSGRKPENRARIEPAAQVAPDRNVRAQSQPHGLLQHVTELGHVLRIRPFPRLLGGARVVEIPVRDQLEVLIGGDQVVTGRHLKHAVEQRANLMASTFHRLRDRFGIPTRRNAGGEQGFHLGSEIQRLVMEGVEQRLDAETIAGSKDRAVLFIPNDEGKFAAQTMETLRSEILVKVERDFAIRARPQPVTGLLELPLDRLVTVELAVRNDVTAAILARDGLFAGRKVDDAEARVTEARPAVGG